LRLTGTSLAAADGHAGAVDFEALLQDAIDLLEDKSAAFSDADEARDRLLQGYQHIFVDEYQDIDEQQYALVSALAGRTQSDSEAKLSIMAVGDDDQNIYSFKGASVEFIRRFQTDYSGEVTYLVENFRSTQNIIAAANHVIQRATDRMKVDHPIRIDSKRALEPAGGRWTQLDAVGQGRVRLITAPADANRQAQVVFDEIARIRRSDPSVALGTIAVLARTHRSLEPLRALCDLEDVRYEMVSRDGARTQLSLMNSREGRLTADLLRARRSDLLSMPAFRRWLARQVRRQPANPYWEDLAVAAGEFAESVGTDRLAAAEVTDALYEADVDERRGHQPAALKLMTAHSAKGLEFGHVVVMDCADWRWNGEDERRLLYVAMTRARETLTLMRAEGGRNPYLVDLGTVDGVSDLLPSTRPAHRTDLDREHFTLGPADVDIGFAGRQEPSNAVHRWIAELAPGDPVIVEGRQIKTLEGHVVGRLASKTELQAAAAPIAASVTGIMVRVREQTSPEFLGTVRTDRWEVVIAELVLPSVPAR
jgi:ATP-dependent DNA helicase RecQ